MCVIAVFQAVALTARVLPPLDARRRRVLVAHETPYSVP